MPGPHASAVRERLGRVGIWTQELDKQPAAVVRDTVAELDELGFGAIWFGESPRRREPFANAALMLGASSRIVVATGVAVIWARDSSAAASGQRTLAEAWPGRFLLGVGISHAPNVQRRGHRYEAPIETMRAYLRAMSNPGDSDVPEPALPPSRVVGALGPLMMQLARDESDGAHPYLVTPEHTSWARGVLGPRRLLCPEQAVVLETDGQRARDIARSHLGNRFDLPNYRRNFVRMGFSDADFASGGSNRLLDALVAWGSLDQLRARVAMHHSAGADHVAVQVLTGESRHLPLREWRALAEALEVR